MTDPTPQPDILPPLDPIPQPEIDPAGTPEEMPQELPPQPGDNDGGIQRPGAD